MELKEALAEFITELQGISDLRRVPPEPPEDNDQFPFLVLYPITGVYRTGPPGLMVGLHDVNAELHIVRKVDLAREFAQVMNLIDDIPKKLYQGILDSSKFTEFTFGGSGEEGISYTFGPLSWAGVDTIGVTFTIHRVKVTMNIK
jgi:hypothetical protein